MCVHPVCAYFHMSCEAGLMHFAFSFIIMKRCVCVCRYREYSSKASVLEAAQNSSPCGRVGSWKRCCNSTDSVPYLYDINVFCPSPFPPLNFIFMAIYSGMCV